MRRIVRFSRCLSWRDHKTVRAIRNRLDAMAQKTNRAATFRLPRGS